MKLLLSAIFTFSCIVFNIEAFSLRAKNLLQHFDLSLKSEKDFDEIHTDSATTRKSVLRVAIPAVTAATIFAPYLISRTIASLSSFPLYGSEEIMSKKQHGTSDRPVQSNLRWGCDPKLADRICNYNRDWAEHAGYWTSETKFLKEINGVSEIEFFDSVTGKKLFVAPRGRTMEKFIAESRSHGWPSFRDEEVIWDNVRCLKGGETVSLTGTHLGHNLPDFEGNRYI